METQEGIAVIKTLRNRLSGLERKLRKASEPVRRKELSRRIEATQTELEAARHDHFGSAESTAAQAS
jgi:hypothetical protein